MNHSLSKAFTSFNSRYKLTPLPEFYLWFFHLWHKNILLCVVNNRKKDWRVFFVMELSNHNWRIIQISTQFSIFKNFTALNDNICLEKH